MTEQDKIYISYSGFTEDEFNACPEMHRKSWGYSTAQMDKAIDDLKRELYNAITGNRLVKWLFRKLLKINA